MPVKVLYSTEAKLPAKKIRKYRMDRGSTFSGVRIHRRIWGVNSMPITVSSTPHRHPKATSVWMAASSRSSSLPPNQRLMMTPAPMVRPMKKAFIMKIRLPLLATAASDSFPAKRPTTMLSKVL